MKAAYDRIGVGYSENRRTDPRIAAAVAAALGEVETVANVGAGTGSYEPEHLEVTAFEPSAEMIAQRPAQAGTAVQAKAEELPVPDDSFDASMAILTIHHWEDRRRGVAEMLRIARRRVVVVTFDVDSLQRWWINDYAPDIADEDRGRFPPIDELSRWLGGAVVSPLKVAADCSDLFLAALWARPELILNPKIRASTSGFARLSDETEARAVDGLTADLASGEWDRRYGDLRSLESLDVGLRVLIADA